MRGFARSVALVGVIAAGVCTGYFASIALGGEGTATYCSYQVTNLTAKDVAFLQAHGWEAGLVAQANNSSYICEPCTGSTVSCGASPVYPPGLPNPLLYDGSYSAICGNCHNPGA